MKDHEQKKQKRNIHAPVQHSPPHCTLRLLLLTNIPNPHFAPRAPHERFVRVLTAVAPDAEVAYEPALPAAHFADRRAHALEFRREVRSAEGGRDGERPVERAGQVDTDLAESRGRADEEMRAGRCINMNINIPRRRADFQRTLSRTHR